MSETVLNDTTEYTRYIIDDKVVTIIGKLQDERNDCGPVGVGIGAAEYVSASVNSDKNSVVLLEYKDPRVSLHGIDEIVREIYPNIRNKRQIVPFDYRIYFLGQKNEYRLYRNLSVYKLSKEDIVKMFINPFFDKYKEAFKMSENLYPEYFLGWLEYFVGIMTKKLSGIKRSADTVSNAVIIDEIQRFWTALPTFYVLREIFRKTSSKNIFVMAEGHYSKITSMMEMVYLENKDHKMQQINPVRTGECISVPGPKMVGTHDLYGGLPDVIRQYMVDEYVDLPGLEAQIAMVKQHPEKLKDIPNPHPDVIMTAVKSFGMALRYIRKDLQTPELVMAAVDNTGMALQFVREDLQTPRVVLAAISSNANALKFVRDDLKTPELAMFAVKRYSGAAFPYVKIRDQTPELAMAAVKSSGRALGRIPVDLQTPEIATAAVKKDGEALKWVREDLMTPRIIRAAIKNTGMALEFVPKELQTPEMVLDAVKQNAYAIWYVRDDLKTPELEALSMEYQYYHRPY